MRPRAAPAGAGGAAPLVLSFAGRNPCTPDAEAFSPCAHTFRGFRKVAVSTAAPTSESSVSQPSPPHYIHGDPREAKVAADSGIFVLHLRSDCALTQAHPPRAASSVSKRWWLDDLLEARGWNRATSLPSSVQRQQRQHHLSERPHHVAGDGSGERDGGFCPSTVFGKDNTWKYDVADEALGRVDNAGGLSRVAKDNSGTSSSVKVKESARDVGGGRGNKKSKKPN